jgi:hypothetical protein
VSAEKPSSDRFDVESTDAGRDAVPNSAAVAEPDLPPPTMPASARTGAPPPTPARATPVRSDGDLAAGGIPPGTGPEAPAAEGTTEAAPLAQGLHQPEIDEDAPPLTTRPLTARGPSQAR